jgi:Transposase
MVAKSYTPGAVVSEVARQNGISPQHLSAWRKAAPVSLAGQLHEARLGLGVERNGVVAPILLIEGNSEKRCLRPHYRAQIVEIGGIPNMWTVFVLDSPGLTGMIQLTCRLKRYFDVTTSYQGGGIFGRSGETSLARYLRGGIEE